MPFETSQTLLRSFAATHGILDALAILDDPFIGSFVSPIDFHGASRSFTGLRVHIAVLSGTFIGRVLSVIAFVIPL